ncbi:hypothetical protein PAHAL_6G073900 [Panicum hallii]|uniref:Uncharacterized protein n=1 Tax=Panicum hallii TaxID=206008 RepID=A0A2T8IFJ2_9POAL|nr:hypothetical protein PAHAL_6G073900 [Panicum hallii]
MGESSSPILPDSTFSPIGVKRVLNSHQDGNSQVAHVDFNNMGSDFSMFLG